VNEVMLLLATGSIDCCSVFKDEDDIALLKTYVRAHLPFRSCSMPPASNLWCLTGLVLDCVVSFLFL
jgi:hypothetical protein